MLLDSTKVKIIDRNMHFMTVNVKNLSEEDVFIMIKNGFLTQGQYVQWLEGIRDQWFAIGRDSVTKC